MTGLHQTMHSPKFRWQGRSASFPSFQVSKAKKHSYHYSLSAKPINEPSELEQSSSDFAENTASTAIESNSKTKSFAPKFIFFFETNKLNFTELVQLSTNTGWLSRLILARRVTV